MTIGKIFTYLTLAVFSIVTLVILGVHYIYKPTTTGTIYLKNAGSDIEIIREVETGIPHIFASDEKSALYA